MQDDPLAEAARLLAEGNLWAKRFIDAARCGDKPGMVVAEQGFEMCAAAFDALHDKYQKLTRGN